MIILTEFGEVFEMVSFYFVILVFMLLKFEYKVANVL